MLDDYLDIQPVAVKIFKKAIDENKISHAYLIDTNNYSKSFELILCFVKMILCPNSHLSNSKQCSICHQIDSGNYLELKIIEPDGMWIKKEQLAELQDSFSTKAISGTKRVYIIKDCDKMNSHAANSILKFLEEPVSDIIAILMTNNISNLLETIVSRCQLIKLNNDIDRYDNTLDKLFIDKENIDIINNILNFIDELNNKKLECIINAKKIWHNYFNNTKLVEQALDFITKYYYDLLLVKNEELPCYFVDYVEHINRISELNTIEEILKKLDILTNACSNLKFNLNLNLFIDKLIIDMVGV